MESLDELRAINASFPYNEPIKRWEAKGKKSVASLCIYVPEEIIHAAGMLPIRLTADSPSLTVEKANVYMAESTCSFIRACLERGLEGGFDYLDGIASCTACQGYLRLSEVWDYYIPEEPVIYTLDLPRIISERVVDFYKKEILGFKEALEKRFNIKVTDEAIRKSIKLCNETRVLLKELYETRRSDEPPISGAETMEVTNAMGRMPREEYNTLLQKLLRELKGRKAYPPGERTRAMILGSPMNDAKFIREIEALGFSIVVDELCMGGKLAISGLIDDSPETDPIDAISNYYIKTQMPCPREIPKEIRSDWIAKLAKEYRVEGAISLLMRYCNNAIWSQPFVNKEFEKLGIPSFTLDMEYNDKFSGQFKTRLEAFLESIAGI